MSSQDLETSMHPLRPLAIALFALALSPAAHAAVGGPDGYGYTWYDSDDGAVYDYDTAATALGLGGDGYSSISIGFDFEYYGTTYSSVTVSADGGMHFGTGALPNDNQPLQYSSYQMILPLWDALAPDGGGDVYYETTGTSPNRVLVVEWRDIPHYAAVYPYYSAGDSSFEVKLFEVDDSIEFHYQDTNFGDAAYNYGASATVGIQEGVLGYYLEYSYNTASLTDGWAIHFEPCLDDDGDGYTDDYCGGTDCDDEDAAVNPGAAEVACDYIDNDCDGGLHDEEIDDDGDGYDECQGDCDDTDADINPDAAEEDCDYVDDGGDGDLHGDEVDDDGDGYDECQLDCDDANADANPGAAEECNGFDDDCDADVDEEDAVGCTTYYADVDDDGYGVTGDSRCLCAPEDPHDATLDGDCDDADPAVNPGAAEAACDYIDNDCDGALHGNEVDDDGDGYDECNNDCDDTSPAVNPGVTEITCNGIDDDCFAATLDDPDVDGDGDGLCSDCDDSDPYLNLDDLDGDGFSTCTDDCDDTDPDLNPADLDADGVSTCDGDCDDADPNNSPALSESHDGQDNDCDGLVDNGVLPPDALIITEVMKNSWVVDDVVGEWFELLNDTGVDMNLVGLVVSDTGTNSFTVDTDLWVAAGGMVVLGREDDSFLNGGVFVDYEWSNFPLSNEEDEIILTHGGVELDRVQWWDPAWPDMDGAAMSLDPAAHDTVSNDDPDSWCNALDAFGDGDYGTPGADNPLCCWDDDGDGFVGGVCGEDCDDTDPDVNPDAEEVCNGIDDDCDPATDENVDADGDGFTICDGDCDDANPDVNPAAEEICNGVDDDCDPFTDEAGDFDGDGVSICDDDCDDADPTIYPAAPELCDGLDNDCDGLLPPGEADMDLDGYRLCDQDCDDGDPTTWPGAPELCDGVDNDCDGDVDEDVDTDVDGDGYNACQGDCDNNDATVYPGAPELCDGQDNDCDGQLPPEETDADGDGWMVCDNDCDDADADLNLDDADADGYSTCDGDCNDFDADLHLDDLDGDGASPCDGDCDDTDADLNLADADGDGWSTCDGDCDDDDAALNLDDADADGFSTCDDDCDDADDSTYPGASEVPYDGIDQDCDGEDAVDVDGDGFAGGDGGDDCDDEDAAVNPDATEVCDDGVDNDCDGLVDTDDAEDCEAGDDDTTVVDDDDDSLPYIPTDEGELTGGCTCGLAGTTPSRLAGVAAVLVLGLGVAVRRRRVALNRG